MQFEKLCRKVVGKLKIKEEDKERVNKRVSKEFLDSLHFTGIDLEPYEIIYFSYICALISFLITFLISISIFAIYGFSIRNMGFLTIFLIILLLFVFPLLSLHYVSEYPKIKAKYMKARSLGDIPEIISYLVMYLKLVPNLERAFNFAAKESNSSLSKDLRKIIWDLQIRIHKSIDDAITYFANLWGEWNEYLRRAIHLIRNSVKEKENERVATLDRALDVVLEGTRDLMIDFSNKLHQPTLIIYSLGFMLPIATMAMLPAVNVIGLRFSIFHIIIFYDILLPVFLFFYIRKILANRPATFNPPSIPSKKIRNIKNILISIFLFLPFLALFLRPPTSLFSKNFFLIWGVAISVSIYCLLTYNKDKKERDKIRKMEKEFGDALYILGRRVAEGKPPEEAFNHVAQAMKGSTIGEVFAKAFYNLISRRIKIENAFFDEEYGALANVYSDRIKAIIKIFIEGVKKSYEYAGIAIVKIADHLKQLQDVEKKIRDSLSSITSSLRSTATFFAPLIGGVTLGMTNLMQKILSSLNFSFSEDVTIPIFGKIFYVETTGDFAIVIGIYIILLVFLILRLANGIDEGDDKIEYFYGVGKSLPIAVFIFTISSVFSYMIFSSL
ncbi:MAG: hypothetical protein H5T44_02980 [Thermoplasmatales archaeon]|nr:hypothetical protein [Thermoplasmatales archaeon]